MENIQPNPFLETWHFIMLISAIIMFLVGALVFIFHHIKISSFKTPKEKYDYASRREIKNYKLVFIFLGLSATMLINRYGMNAVNEMGVWFFVRLFISIAGGTLVSYVAFLVLEYYYPSKLDKKLHQWRYTPRINPKTGNKMRLLAEHEEDVHLDAGMKAEEDVFSIDYDVWIDEQTDDVIIEKYQGHLQALECGNCGFFTLKVVREEITRQPTLNTPGELIKHYECSYCQSVRRTAFNISTMEAADYKKGNDQTKRNKDVVLVKVEIRSASGGSRFYEFGDLVQAQKFLTEIDE